MPELSRISKEIYNGITEERVLEFLRDSDWERKMRRFGIMDIVFEMVKRIIRR